MKREHSSINSELFLFVGAVSALTLAAIQQKGTQNLKRKNTKTQQKGAKKPRQRKQSKENSNQDNEESDLSETDKKLLERWENMRKTTKPFIHPIRKYMDELHALKEEALETEQMENTALSSAAQPVQQFQFTQFVPQDCNGNVATLKAVKVPFTVAPNVLLQHTEPQAIGMFIRLLYFSNN